MKSDFCNRPSKSLAAVILSLVVIMGQPTPIVSSAVAADSQARSNDKSSNKPSKKSDRQTGNNDDEPGLSLLSSDGVQSDAKSSRQPSVAKRATEGTIQIGNSLREEQGAVQLIVGFSDESELSLEAQQARDQGECPGSEESDGSPNRSEDDLPLDQDEHPFDAPAAESEEHEDDSDATEQKLRVAQPSTNAPIDDSRDQVLHRRINLCLAHYFTHQENLATRSPWAVMHTILPYGVETDILAGKRSVNAIGWMCYNGVCKTQRMFQPTQRGFRTNVGPGVQGHEGQFLAILAQSSVPRDFPIIVGKTRYTVSDLIRYEMSTCREKSELTFKLIGLSHYLAPRQAWRDDRGQVWNLEKLVREELEQPVVGAACGGTHRLMGLSYALMMRRRYKEPIVGHWARAEPYIKDFIQYAWSLQNPDGSFSTDWFEGRADKPDLERKLQTTGHILEWLIFTLPAEDLDDPRVGKSIDYLLSQVYDRRDKDWPIGPRGHALRALALYNQRVFGAPTGQLKSYLAQSGFVKELR